MNRTIRLLMGALLVLPSVMFAQVLREDFTGALGTQLTTAGWTQSGSTATNPVTIDSAGLTLTQFPGSGVGNAAVLKTSGQDVYRSFAALNSGSVYLSFMLKVSSAATGDYFIALSPSALQTNYYGRLHIKASGGGFSVGLNKSNEVTGGAVYGTTVIGFDTTVAVVMKYTFSAGDSNDVIDVYVMKDSLRLAEPGSPEIAAYAANTKADAADLGYVTVRQGGASSAAALVIDGINVGRSWKSVSGQTASVTFNVNTASVEDTLKANSSVQVRGSAAPLTWGGDSPMMTNVGGDYWSITHVFDLGTSVNYKYFVTWSGDGWEGGSDKALTVDKDTVLALAYWNRTSPVYTPSDSMDVWFRVHMGSRPDFDPATDSVQVRGTFNGWSASNPLAREGVSKFYSGQVKIPTVALDSAKYKFTFTKTGGTYWEDAIGDRLSLIRGDTTLVWKSFEDKPIVQVLPVTVTILVNTSTVPDTLKPTSFVQMRGGTPPLTWDQTSPVMFTNIGGDYWTANVEFFPGATVQYKIFTFANGSLTADDYGAGWENNTTDGSGNRTLTVGSADTVLPLAFVNGSATTQDQYWRPYTLSDSVDVWFRVNLQSRETFKKGIEAIGVRGSFNGWGPKSLLLKQEAQHGNNGSRKYDALNFWSGVAKIPASAFAGGAVEYKYVVLDANTDSAAIVAWENVSNRTIAQNAAQGDTTLYWKWFDDIPYAPPVVKDTIIVTFRANMNRAISERGFSIGDTLDVRSGYNATAQEVRIKRMTRQGLSTYYQAIDTVVANIGKDLNYQYYVTKNGIEVREIYYDFNYLPAGDAAAEKRRIAVTSNTMSVQDTSTSTANTHRVPRFKNLQHLTQNVTVTYTVDVRPAIYTLLAGKSLVATNITAYVLSDPDSVLLWGVWMNGPAVGGWDTRGAWGSARRADTTSHMYDDGTHGDLVAGDSVFSLLYDYTTADVVGQEFKFGIGGFDNEGGFGNNHNENINDAGSTWTIASQFGSIDPTFYDAWDFDNQVPRFTTGVSGETGIPLAYELRQNYPNPFNPSTTIQFALPKAGNVSLKVFNTLGQEVATVVAGVLTPGIHTVTFDASRLSTGVYFYQIKAGDFMSLRKMVLVK